MSSKNIEDQVTHVVQLFEAKKMKQIKKYVDQIENSLNSSSNHIAPAEEIILKALERCLVQKRSQPVGMLTALYTYKQLVCRAIFQYTEQQSFQQIHKFLYKTCTFNPTGDLSNRGKNFFKDTLKIELNQQLQNFGTSIVTLALEIVHNLAVWYEIDYFTDDKSRYSQYLSKLIEKKVKIVEIKDNTYFKAEDHLKFKQKYKAFLKRVEQQEQQKVEIQQLNKKDNFKKIDGPVVSKLPQSNFILDDKKDQDKKNEAKRERQEKEKQIERQKQQQRQREIQRQKDQQRARQQERMKQQQRARQQERMKQQQRARQQERMKEQQRAKLLKQQERLKQQQRAKEQLRIMQQQKRKQQQKRQKQRREKQREQQRVKQKEMQKQRLINLERQKQQEMKGKVVNDQEKEQAVFILSEEKTGLEADKKTQQIHHNIINKLVSNASQTVVNEKIADKEIRKIRKQQKYEKQYSNIYANDEQFSTPKKTLKRMENISQNKKGFPKTQNRNLTAHNFYHPHRNLQSPGSFRQQAQFMRLKDLRQRKKIVRNSFVGNVVAQKQTILSLLQRSKLYEQVIPYVPQYFHPLTQKMTDLIQQTVRIEQRIRAASKYFFQSKLIQARLIKSSNSYILSIHNVSQNKVQVGLSYGLQAAEGDEFSRQIKIGGLENKKFQEPSIWKIAPNEFLDIAFDFYTSDPNFKFLLFPILVNQSLVKLHLPITLLDQGLIDTSLDLEEISEYIKLSGRVMKTTPILLEIDKEELTNIFNFSRYKDNIIAGNSTFYIEKEPNIMVKVTFLIKKVKPIEGKFEILALYDNKNTHNEDFAKVLLELFYFLFAKQKP